MRRTIGLIVVMATLATAAVNYSYDNAGRLTKVDYGAAGQIVYAYDKAGNLLSRTAGPSTGGGSVIISANTAGSPASAGIAQNTWVEIRGSNLVAANTPAVGVIWSTAPEFQQGQMPVQLGDVSVTVNGKAAYIYFFCSAVTSPICASDQINVLTPLDTNVGTAQIVVKAGNISSAPFTVSVKPVVPSLLMFSPLGYVVATHPDFSLLAPATLYPGFSTPATAGETVTLWAVGFGLPTTTLTPGSSVQSGSLVPMPVCTIANAPVSVSFAGVVSPGLYLLNIKVPLETAPGDKAISCSYGGGSTPPGDLISVQ